MVEGGGLTLSVPPGQKLLVIHVTFSSTTCTWGRRGTAAVRAGLRAAPCPLGTKRTFRVQDQVQTQ